MCRERARRQNPPDGGVDRSDERGGDPRRGRGLRGGTRPSGRRRENTCTAFRAPGVWNIDAALYKNFQIKEGKRIQLRLETYNVLNHANLFVSGGEAEVNTGFVPASFDGRRNIQLAGKFIF